LYPNSYVFGEIMKALLSQMPNILIEAAMNNDAESVEKDIEKQINAQGKSISNLVGFSAYTVAATYSILQNFGISLNEVRLTFFEEKLLNKFILQQQKLQQIDKDKILEVSQKVLATLKKVIEEKSNGIKDNEKVKLKSILEHVENFEKAIIKNSSNKNKNKNSFPVSIREEERSKNFS